MLDYARGQNRFPISTIRQLKTYEQTVADLKNELGRQPTKREISAKMGIKPYRIDQLIFYDSLDFVPVDALIENDEGEQREAMLIDHKPTPEKVMVHKEFRHVLENSMKILNPNERQAFELYFYRDMRLREVADRMHITEARACQLKNGAVKKLRRFLVQEGVME
nr:MAG TPA: RNA polymerase sigma factor [Caudoviricetes sp.]